MQSGGSVKETFLFGCSVISIFLSEYSVRVRLSGLFNFTELSLDLCSLCCCDGEGGGVGLPSVLDMHVKLVLGMRKLSGRCMSAIF